MKRILDDLKKNSRWINIIYVENEENLGISKTLNKGVLLCPDEIIFRMDSDDIMINNRIYKQLEFMLKNKDCVMCGTQIAFFNNNKASKNSLSFNINNITGRTSHPNYTFEEYKIKKSHWIMNHPTLCFIKSAIIEVGNYNNNIRGMIEDLDLELRVLKKYGKIYNLPDILLYYRLHNNQLTYNGGTEGSEYWINKRNELINNLINI
jgi:GT2 family glycosyltransferase